MKGILVLDDNVRILLIDGSYVYNTYIILYKETEHAVLEEDGYLCVYYRTSTGKYAPLHNLPIELIEILLKGEYKNIRTYKKRLV